MRIILFSIHVSCIFILSIVFIVLHKVYSGTGYAQPGVSQQACTSYPCLMFEDNFDFLNFETWTHELTASGGGVRIHLRESEYV